MSKGSWYRPVNKKKYDENYEKIFGLTKKKQPDHHDACVFGKTCLLVCTKECLIGELIEAGVMKEPKPMGDQMKDRADGLEKALGLHL